MLPNLLWLGRMCAAEQSGAGRGPVNGLRVLVLIIAWLSGPGYWDTLRARVQQLLHRYFRKMLYYCFLLNHRQTNIPICGRFRQFV